jgi:hypothetical protein
MRLLLQKGNGRQVKKGEKSPPENPNLQTSRCDNLRFINSGAISLETYPSR